MSLWVKQAAEERSRQSGQSEPKAMGMGWEELRRYRRFIHTHSWKQLGGVRIESATQLSQDVTRSQLLFPTSFGMFPRAMARVHLMGQYDTWPSAGGMVGLKEFPLKMRGW